VSGKRKYEGPMKLDMSFNEAMSRYAQTDPKELDPKSNDNRGLARKMASQELGPAQGSLDLRIERAAEVDGIGMGVLKDGTAFLTGRGLARLVGIENLHIRTIGQEWNDPNPKPRTEEIKRLLAKRGIAVPSAYIETTDGERPIHAFPEPVCLAVLEYYAFDAAKPRETARDNYRILAGKALRDLIYSQVGYDPTGQDRFKNWHDRIALNYQSAPKGYFHVFNEAHTIIYELIQAGAQIGEKFVVDISIGQHWGKYWTDNDLASRFGERCTYPHCYPDTHPQSKSNPQESWCYPLASLGAFREWLQDIYIEGGKFSSYLKGKVSRGELPPSVAQLAISTLVPPQIEGPRA
jgi:hypothetical protein